MDRSLMIFDARKKLCAVLPAAQDPNDPSCVVSHPGATFGGLLLSAQNSGVEVFEVLSAACRFFAQHGFSRLLYKAVPAHLHKKSCQTDLYALWRQVAKLYRRDLWSLVDLSIPRQIEENRRRHLRRAARFGVNIIRENSAEAYESFYKLLSSCLEQRHGVSPVHSLEEMQILHQKFPDEIQLWLATDSVGECLAGEWIFNFGHTHHGQYGASSDLGRQYAAQDLLLNTIMDNSKAEGARFFSFGTSTEQQGKILNKGLFNYKASFGAGTVARIFIR